MHEVCGGNFGLLYTGNVINQSAYAMSPSLSLYTYIVWPNPAAENKLIQ